MKRFIFAILVTIIALISLSGCLGKGGDYVAEIGNTKISRGEFMVYLIEQKKNFEEQGGSDIWEADFDGVSAIEVAKQNALDSITMVKSAVKQTDSLGIKLDEKDISDIDNQTKSLMSEFSSEELTELSLDYDKIHSILEESALQSKVYDYVTSNYVVNSDEMNKYIEEYKKKTEESYKNTVEKYSKYSFFDSDIKITKDKVAVNYRIRVADESFSYTKYKDVLDEFGMSYFYNAQKDAFIYDETEFLSDDIPLGSIEDVACRPSTKKIQVKKASDEKTKKSSSKSKKKAGDE